MSCQDKKLDVRKEQTIMAEDLRNLPTDPQDPPADPNPQDPSTDEAEETTNPPKPTIDDVLAEINELKLRTEKADAKRQKAEEALELERRAHSELKKEKRLKMSEADQLQEEREELEREKAAVRIEKNTAIATKILSEIGFSETELTDEDLAFFVDDDEETTRSRCEWMVTTLKSRERKIEKTAVENYVKSQPHILEGVNPKDDDDYATRYKKAVADKNQALAIAIKQEAYDEKGIVLR